MPASNRHPRSANSVARSRRALRLESLEQRNLFAALPLGAAPMDTAEYMVGRVAVVPILLESNGQIDPNTENWTPESIQATLAKIRSGVDWWSEALDRLGTVHELEFVIDDQFALNPYETPYEAISRPSQFHSTIVGAFLEDQGYGDAGSIDNAIRLFNNDARQRLQTDWAFSILIVNSANDDDGQFGPGSEFNNAFAYPGGQYVVAPSTRPVSTITHEVGHIFWARDEYPGGGSWTDRRGYYNAQNWNASDNPTQGFVQEPSIMRSGTGLSQSFFSYELPESTMAMLGWRDSDGDGIFDVLDVPLSLQGSGRYNQGTGVFSFSGFATAVALPNQNSAGFQNDITLNRVDRIEYRIDGGAWQTATTIGKQFGDVDFQLVLEPFSSIEIRAIDDSSTVTSAVYGSDSFLPLLAGASIGGVAYLDNGTGEAENSPALLSGVTATLVRADGTSLPFGTIDPDQFTTGIALPPTPGVTFTALGQVLDGRVGTLAAASSTGSRAFGFFSNQTGNWQSRWAPDKKLVITFDEPVGNVELDAVGLSSFSQSFGRLEAYDASGALLSRYSTSGLLTGRSETMVVTDAAGRIASVRAFGHALSDVGLDRLRYGSPSELQTSSDGVFEFSGVPDGDYRLHLTAENLIYSFPMSGEVFSIQNGVSSSIAAGFQRVRSPWTNPVDQFDVDQNTRVEPLDALRILNDLAQNGSRTLRDPSQINVFIDANNDGILTPLDALVVLNEIARRNRQPSEGESFGGGSVQNRSRQSFAQAADTLYAAWPGELNEKKSSNDLSDEELPEDSIGLTKSLG